MSNLVRDHIILFCSCS